MNKGHIKKCCELIKKHTGLTPYKEQIKAAKELCKGNIVDMKTGEGKTLSVLLAMLLKTQEGRKVYVVTSNDYLSKRDYEYSKPILKELGIRSIFFQQSIGGTKKEYEENDVIYATGETLIFDYLRGVEAEYDFAIIDEIDFILVESANHDFSVSDGKDLVKMPTELFKVCKTLSDYMTIETKTERHKREEIYFDLQYAADVLIEPTRQTVEITDLGYKKLWKMFGKKATDKMFIEVLLATLKAKYCFVKDVNYMVENNEIVLINENNGRKSIGGSTDICVQSAIELKEGLEITDKSLLHNTCSYPVFFTIFKTITGISGTTSYVPYDFSTIFDKKVVKVKEHFPNQRVEHYEYYKTDDERIERIKEIVANTKTPILIVSASDKRSQKIKEILSPTSEKVITVLDNTSLEEETKLLDSIKRDNAVLVSSKIVGRGTDIDLPPHFEEGLLVIMTERFLSERAEKQIIGRTGRNGKKGTCYILTSHDDTIFNMEDKDRKKHSESYIRKLQSRYEQKAFEQRKHIYIRSKLFFDQDKAIRDKLNSFESYEELLDFVSMKVDTKETELSRKVAKELLEHAIENDFQYTKYHKQLLLHKYSKIRPFYQQQFLQYNDNMAQTLYDNSDFYFRCKEYIEIGKDVIFECINMLMLTVTGGENGVRKKEIQTETTDG